MKARLALVALAFVAAACASLRPEPPQVDFRGVALKDVALSGATIDVVLAVRNPNAFGIDIRRLAYSLYADSTLVGMGQPLGQLQIPARDSSIVRLPVAFEYRSLGMVVVQLITQGEVNYKVKGDVTVGTPIGDFNRPFESAGRFNARQAIR
ncbi:MAG: LEA type 2 family protein [Gemmatimonadetes bacterium]|nr:LEA type 2 family protein [Gemmatimonadota bacterium]